MTSSDLEFHAFCLTNTGSRLDQFAAGHRDTHQTGDTVVDLGARNRNPVLSRLPRRRAPRLRHRGWRVTGVRSCARGAERLLDRIEFINNRSTSLVLPERVNAIVGDTHDTFGLQRVA
jgi:hypothetical protein